MPETSLYHSASSLRFSESTLLTHASRSLISRSKINRLNRNVRLREEIKAIYDFKCQVCGIYLEKPHGAIAIGAHIKGLGEPHNGPDVLENMLCLCPNHHDQFDSFSFYVDPKTLHICGLKGFEGQKIRLSKKHKLDPEFLEYHKDLYKRVADR